MFSDKLEAYYFWRAVLEFGLRTLCLLRQAFYHVSHTPTLFALVIFQVGPHVPTHTPKPTWIWILPTYASHIAGMTDACHHAGFFVEMGSC
jgi:hypothetical protein